MIRVREWVMSRVEVAYMDLLLARCAYHACTGTPIEDDARRYLERTQRRYEHWRAVYVWLDRKRRS